MTKKLIIILLIALIVSFGSGFLAGEEYKAYQVAKALSDVFNKPTASNTTTRYSDTIPDLV
jgi:hypothetical protein